MDTPPRASGHPESALKLETDTRWPRGVRSATAKNKYSRRDAKPFAARDASLRETRDEAEQRAQRSGGTKLHQSQALKRIAVDTKVSALSPVVSKPRSVRPSNRRCSEMVHENNGLTLLGKQVDNADEEMYETNGAPPARLLPVAKISYVDQTGWRYWLCDDIAKFRSAYAYMLPSPNDPSRREYISCFARPDPQAQFNTEESNTPFPGSRLVLTRISDRAQVVCVVVESGHDLDHADQSSRKTRCILLRNAPAS